VTGYQNN